MKTNSKMTDKKTVANNTGNVSPISTKQPVRSTPRVARTQANTPNQEQIASRAYEKFVARGYDHGHDLEDWLNAEAELKR